MIRLGDIGLLKRSWTSFLKYNIALRVVGFINHVIAFRILGLSGFGRLAFLDTFAILAAMLISVGFPHTLERWGPRYKQDVDGRLKIYALVNFALLKNVLLGGAVCIAIYSFRDYWSGWLSLEALTAEQTLLVCGIILLRALAEPQESFLSFNYEQPYLNLRDLVISLINIGLFYLVLLTWEVSVLSMLATLLVSSLVRTLFLSAKYFRSPEFSWAFREGYFLLRQDVSPMLRYSMSMWANSLLSFLAGQRGQDYFVQIVLGERTFGVYALGKKLVTLAEDSFFPKQVRQVVGTRGYEILVSGGPLKVKEFLKSFLGVMWLVQGTIAIGGIILAPPLLQVIYGLPDPQTSLYVQALFLSVFFVRWLGIYEYCVTIIQRPYLFVVAQSLAFPAAILAYPFLLERMGLMGGVIVSVAISLLTALFYSFEVGRHLDFRIDISRYVIYLIEGVMVFALFAYGISPPVPAAVMAALAAILFHATLMAVSGIADCRKTAGGFFHYRGV